MTRTHLLLLGFVVAFSVGLPVDAGAKDKTVTEYGSMFFRKKLKPDEGDPQGCLVGTMGRKTGKGAVSLQLYLHPEGYKTINTHSTVSVLWSHGGWFAPKADITDGDELRDTFRVCLRPGKYFMYGLGIGLGGMTMVPDRAFHFPIEVKAGQTRYIGSFVALFPGQEDDCGGDPAKYRILARNRADVDRAYLEPAGGNAAPPMVVDVPDFSGLRPLIYACRG